MRKQTDQPSQAERDQAKRTRRLNQPIPEDVHRALKAHAALKGQKIPDALEELLRQALDLPPRQGSPCVA